jgi:hypothetical protein
MESEIWNVNAEFMFINVRILHNKIRTLSVYVPNAFISGLFYEAVNGSDYTELIG